jgi:LemA protein
MYFIAAILSTLTIYFIIRTHNSLVRLRNQARNAFSNIDVLLTKRYDLIPNLVKTVQGYMKHEQRTLESITALRAEALSHVPTEDEKLSLDSELSKSINRIVLAAEAYPELKANQNFMQLQRTITEVEERLSAVRRSYNMAVSQYNNLVEMFPSNIVAKAMNYKQKKYFEINSVTSEKYTVFTGAENSVL